MGQHNITAVLGLKSNETAFDNQKANRVSKVLLKMENIMNLPKGGQ